MLLCDVCPGKKYICLDNNVKLRNPPDSYDCVYGKTGRALNYEEITLYDPDPILPKFILLYRKDGNQLLT